MVSHKSYSDNGVGLEFGLAFFSLTTSDLSSLIGAYRDKILMHELMTFLPLSCC